MDEFPDLLEDEGLKQGYADEKAAEIERDEAEEYERQLEEMNRYRETYFAANPNARIKYIEHLERFSKKHF